MRRSRRAELETPAPGRSQGVVNAPDGSPLAVRMRGEGPAFVWAHSLLGCMDQEDTLGVFDWSAAAKGWRHVRYDARGHGHSASGRDPEAFLFSRLAADMLAVAGAAGPAPAVLGGASLGCATALHAACLAPERVRGLLLVIPPTAWQARARQARIYRGLATSLERVGRLPFRVLDCMPAAASGRGTLAVLGRSVVQRLATADARQSAAVLRGAALSDLPPPELLRTLRMPALVLAWAGDATHPLATARRLAQLLPAATLVESPQPSQPPEWSQRVAAFLAALAAQPRAETAAGEAPFAG